MISACASVKKAARAAFFGHGTVARLCALEHFGYLDLVGEFGFHRRTNGLRELPHGAATGVGLNRRASLVQPPVTTVRFEKQNADAVHKGVVPVPSALVW